MLFVAISECKGTDNHSLWLGSTGNWFLSHTGLFNFLIITGTAKCESFLDKKPKYKLKIYDILDGLRQNKLLQINFFELNTTKQIPTQWWIKCCMKREQST